MSKKLMLLAAGALTVVAFTALPSVSSAKETQIKCLGAGACTYTVAAGESKFSTTSGDTVSCTSVTGNGSQTLDANRESTTGEVQLLFHGCKETTTIFKFNCSTPGQPTGTIKPEPMVTHNITDEATFGANVKVGVLLTNAKVTFTCAGGFAATTVTGNVIGTLDENCVGRPASNIVKQSFNTTGVHGQQDHKLYTGVNYDLIGMTNHPTTPTTGGTYETAAQTGTGTLTFNQNVEITC
ncbi:MAG TPA: hypothetical protein VLK37_05235 [Solirubrobacterales bacterium]|nr:hypothetical protein [Solirubrobacterales bacterium]